ncbi:MAG: glucose 1-dehydrogenase [Thermodesulfobacteriota bacterium]|jgi:NAD(P)-dependent dehydrogenase (short-subunit alcohol dehydrogenase family)
MNKQDMQGLFDVNGRVALITGATGGFGKAAARGLAAAGAKVMATARTSSALELLVKEIRESGGQAAFSAGDPINHEDVKRVVKNTVDTFGGIDILVTAAGINKVKPITDQPVQDWEEVMGVNVKGTYLFCKEVGRVMINQGRGGKVILVGSARGHLGLANYTAYSTSKGAVHLLAKTLGCEWGPYKINVNAIAPTVFRTALTQWMFDDNAFYMNFLKRIPLGRLGEPEDFIGTVIFLSSKASDFMTGAIMDVDGGYTAG